MTFDLLHWKICYALLSCARVICRRFTIVILWLARTDSVLNYLSRTETYFPMSKLQTSAQIQINQNTDIRIRAAPKLLYQYYYFNNVWESAFAKFLHCLAFMAKPVHWLSFERRIGVIVGLQVWDSSFYFKPIPILTRCNWQLQCADIVSYYKAYHFRWLSSSPGTVQINFFLPRISYTLHGSRKQQEETGNNLFIAIMALTYIKCIF